MSYWMVLKLIILNITDMLCFRSMSYWMVLKHQLILITWYCCFRSMSYWMVLKLDTNRLYTDKVLDLCHIEWY